MRVSFDLDEVLFVNPLDHKTEPKLKIPFCWYYKERLRLGTVQLIPKLQSMGYEVWVYTSSFRTEGYIRNLFKLYHIHFDGIVNGNRHMREIQAGRRERLPNKMPCYYRISLHIDDEAIVMTQGKAYGFNVYQLDAEDEEWEEKIIAEVKRIHKREKINESNV
ncbi:MAG: HAD family hydrolase [Lachnospiraceae bacterium]|nr:HAD family hydrolase [Lachnospiraceae bacterium]